jgi:glucose/mannose-6-phosphate isomerase
MINLDDPNVYERLDPTNMIARISDMSQQCRQAWATASALPLPSDYPDVDKVIILGMGGSAIGGDMLGALAVDQTHTVIVAHRDYSLPKWVDEKTLVIASSYSGNTEETISAFIQALETPAKKLAITTGGRLQELAAQSGVPLFLFQYKAEPRAAFGYSFFAMLAFVQGIGIIPLKPQHVEESIGTLAELSSDWGNAVPIESNPAKQLAADLYDRLVIIYGAGVLSKVAERWKAQLNECSKTWASAETFPELNHNAVVGYEFPEHLREVAFVLMLRPTTLHARVKIRYDVTCELLDKAGVPHAIVEAEGKNPLSQLMSTVLFGDYVSYYLAILNEVDPSPVEAIDHLKNRLSEFPESL